jgi:hypothetical protein
MHINFDCKALPAGSHGPRHLESIAHSQPGGGNELQRFDANKMPPGLLMLDGGKHRWACASLCPSRYVREVSPVPNRRTENHSHAKQHRDIERH